ncbi:MAG: hypothetical protein QOH49_3010 [Acidobacteriota bacterium]|jgi:hypothetical protein|nr:hypothetical protein [Acidobacteriota bacterium]
MKSAANSFKKTFALAAVVALLIWQPADTSARGARQQKTPFKISSLGTPFGVQVELEGTYVVNEHYVEVSVDRALVYVNEHCPYQGRRLVNTLIVGLATNTPRGSWEIENRSLPIVVERVMSPREEYRLAGLYFQIPRNVGADLTKRWLVVEAEDIALDVPNNDPDKKGYAFAHSRRNLFANPVWEPAR